jgi:hypothetical protein
MRRGNWGDRLPSIDTDLHAMEEKIKNPPSPSGSADADRAIQTATGNPQRPSSGCKHMPPAAFHPGQPLKLGAQVAPAQVTSVHLHYRHVNQGERWVSAEMQPGADGYAAEIPGDYTGSIYPLEYYFELRGAGSAWLHPAFNSTLSNQPYYAIDKRDG